jgi:serine/threonine-protein kinase HipA
MTTSSPVTEAFVWIWLPEATSPVVAGRLVLQGGRPHFTYGRTYRALPSAIAFSPVELPLHEGVFVPEGMSTIHGCLRDAGPDAWGRRVISYRHPTLMADELDYLLLSGSNRIGALDFQASSDVYVPRDTGSVPLAQLMEAAACVQDGRPLPPELETALLHGTSVGGARPKAVVNDGTREYIAKFSSSTDTYDIVKAEYVAMRLAARIGLDVAPVSLRRVMGRDVVLVERFDRVRAGAGFARRSLISLLSLLRLNEMEARYASYADFAHLVRHRFERPSETLEEVFRRLVFNIAVGNTDDHARNHAALWDGRHLVLSPAYDLCPQRRIGREASQAMGLGGTRGNLSTFANACSISGVFLIEPARARRIAEEIIDGVREGWLPACKEAGVSATERAKLEGTALLNPFAFEGW